MEPEFSVGGLIGERWLQLLGEDGPLGRPTSEETGVPDGEGRQQTFEHGTVAWMPHQQMVLSVFHLEGDAVFDWSVTRDSPLHYDYFRIDVLYRRDASTPFVGGGQANMKLHGFTLPELAGTRRGTFMTRLNDLGEYAFTVKGVDGPGFLTPEHSEQGWTPLIRLDVMRALDRPDEPVPTHPLIDERWHALSGPDGPLGRVVAAATSSGDGTVRQEFERGVITTCPALGPTAALAAWHDERSIHLRWGWWDQPPLTFHPDTVTWTVSATDLDGGGAEFQQDVETSLLEWLTWAHHGSTSGYARFFPRRDESVPWDRPSTRHYHLAVTDAAGTSLTADFVFPHQPFPAHLSPPALDTTPEHAAASHLDRLDAIAEHYVRVRPIDLRNAATGEDATFQLIAHLHLASRDRSYRGEGQPRSTVIVAAALRQLTSGEVGTDRDHDAVVKGLLTVILRYRPLLPDPLVTFVLEELVPRGLRGAHDPFTEIYKVSVAGFAFTGPETENHLLMIETSRFLVNQILFERTGLPEFDSLELGLTDWLMRYLQGIAQHDLLEFNSRPYNRYTVHALLNLVEFSADPPLRTAARHVVDYLAVKFAVSSSRNRHLGPFRRRRERVNAPTGDLNELFASDGHPLTGLGLACFGPIAPDGTAEQWFDERWLAEALLFGAGSYRPPAAAYILALEEHPPYQHTIAHGHRPTPTAGEATDGGVEIFYRSPSFVLSAGGMFLNSGSGRDEYVMIATGTNGCAVPQATTLLPTRGDVRFADLVRFDPYTTRGVNTGVHHGFACGGNLRLPGTPDGALGWTFLDHSDIGFVVAAYRTRPGSADLIEPLDSLGFIYVLELRTAGHPDAAPPMTFDEFRSRAIERNQHLPGTLDYGAAYQFFSPDDHQFTFRLWPEGEKYRARVLFFDGEPLPEDFGRALAEGPYLDSPGPHDGYLEIRHPRCAVPLVLDFRHALAPGRRDNGAACPEWLDGLMAAYLARAEAIFETADFAGAIRTTRASLSEFQRHRADAPGLSGQPLHDAAAKWHNTARRAHPHDVPVQLAAAANAWAVYQDLAGISDPTATLAAEIGDLAGYLAFGSPVTIDAVAAGELARRLFASLPGDHRLDVAMSWARQSVQLHEVSFHAGNPDPAAEQARQRAAAAESLAILDPLVSALPDPAFTHDRLLLTASALRWLISTLSFGSPDSSPSVRAAELLAVVYASDAELDHRLDLAEGWWALAVRHHETSFVPGCPDPAGEQLEQRNAAGTSARLVLAVGERAGGSAEQRHRIVELIGRLLGVLTFGAPVPPTPEAIQHQELAGRLVALRESLAPRG